MEVGVLPHMFVCVGIFSRNCVYLEKEALICCLGRISLVVDTVAYGEVRNWRTLSSVCRLTWNPHPCAFPAWCSSEASQVVFPQIKYSLEWGRDVCLTDGSRGGACRATCFFLSLFRHPSLPYTHSYPFLPVYRLQFLSPSEISCLASWGCSPTKLVLLLFC